MLLLEKKELFEILGGSGSTCISIPGLEKKEPEKSDQHEIISKNPLAAISIAIGIAMGRGNCY